jgi:hypothetical protein
VQAIARNGPNNEPVPDHPKFGKWKDEMAPGELWSLFGEKWIAEEGAAR